MLYIILMCISCIMVFPCGSAGKEFARSLGWEDPLEKGRPPTPVFWPGEFHVLYSPWGHKELDTTEWLSLSFSLSLFHPPQKWQLGFWFFCILLSIVWASLVAQIIKNLLAMPETQVWPGRSPGEGNGNPLQYSCLENPRTVEPGRLQSMGSQRVGHDWTTS